MIDKPLSAMIDGDELVIRIGIGTLAFAAEHLKPLPYEILRVIDKAEFANDVRAELMREEEDGSSMLTDVLDAASIAAWENGSIGCHEVRTLEE